MKTTKTVTTETELTPNMKRRLARFDARYPKVREHVLESLQILSFTPEARPVIEKLLVDPKLAAVTRRIVEAVDQKKHWVMIGPYDNIVTSFSGCPRELIPYMLMGGEKMAVCKIGE